MIAVGVTVVIGTLVGKGIIVVGGGDAMLGAGMEELWPAYYNWGLRLVFVMMGDGCGLLR